MLTSGCQDRNPGIPGRSALAERTSRCSPKWHASWILHLRLGFRTGCCQPVWSLPLMQLLLREGGSCEQLQKPPSTSVPLGACFFCAGKTSPQLLSSSCLAVNRLLRAAQMSLQWRELSPPTPAPLCYDTYHNLTWESFSPFTPLLSIFS